MSDKTTAKTISQLQEMNGFSDNPHEIWMEASKPETDTQTDRRVYSSKKFSYITLQDSICTHSDRFIADKYRLSSQTRIVDVLGMDQRVTDLSSNNVTIGGKKNFLDTPTSKKVDVDMDETITDQSMTNVGMVRQIVEKYGSFYSVGSRVDRNPIQYSSSGSVNGSVYDGNTFYYWHIDDRQKDSSKWYDDSIQGYAGPVTVEETGMMTVYGWLADTGTVKAQESWVGLFANIGVSGEDGQKQYVPLQIHPWIQGQKHSVLQYVGFNVPVRKGMELKIMTGFAVDGSNGGLNDGDCLTFKDNPMPNTFIGYVVVNI